jgi:uncharacterized membrane protein YidH (DUF202 family)
MGILLFWIAVLLIIVGAYSIANSICQKRWKEKIPQSKLIGFTSVFVICFTALAFLMFMASMMAFGR